MDKIEQKSPKHNKQSRMSSIEETIQLARLQQAASTSALYERKHNQKALKVLTVAAYMLFVSMAAIILSFYYIFIWDPTSKPIQQKNPANCIEDSNNEKLIIPENIVIRLVNNTEISAENFFSILLKRFREDKERENIKQEQATKLAPRIATMATVITSSQSSVVILRQKDLDAISTTATNLPLTASTSETNSNALSYVDDEDMGNDYEASGSRPLWNDTASFSIINDNDVSD